jgi:hypothetical protein
MEVPMLDLTGRAVFAWDARDAADVTLRALERACDPDHLTAERLADYCEQAGLRSANFERAVLAEALALVSADDLADRLAAAMPRRARRDSLGVKVRGWARAQDEGVVAHVRSAAMEARIALGAGERPALRAASAVPGFLVLDGTVRSAGGAQPAVAAWRVAAGQPLCFGADATTPVETLTALAGQVALSRLSEAFAWRLRALLDQRCRPPLLRAVGRSPRRIRTYLLYWRRLRDFVVWRALHDV